MANNLQLDKRDGGRILIDALARNGVRIDAAFWALSGSTWRLIIVSPTVESKGPKFVLLEISKELEKANGTAGFELFDIDVTGPQTPEIFDLLRLHPMLINGTNITLINVQTNDRIIEGLHSYFFNRNLLIDDSNSLSS